MEDTEYKSNQRKNQVERLPLPIFEGAKADGWYKGGQQDYVLRFEDSTKNLFAPIRKEALEYFARYRITWWNQYEDRYFPTGHLLSSQIHCLNHLFAIRKDDKAVLALIRPIGEKAGVHFDSVLPSFIDKHEAYWDKEHNEPVYNSNYISFEFVCHNMKLLNESHESRGENCTSVDAFVYAKAGKDYWLIPIEWKYTEAYDSTFKDADNYDRYTDFVTPNSRIQSWHNLYRKDPFYELGRQTLLMEQLIKEKPLVGKISSKYPQHKLKADKFLHIVVIPNDNKEMRADAEKFKVQLKDEYKPLFQIIDPQILLNPLHGFSQHDELLTYLQTRYWN